MKRAGDKMKMLEQRIGRRRDATRALTQVPTGWGGFGCPTVTCRSAHTVGQKAINPRGMGTDSPFQKSFIPNSKQVLTKSGESRSALRESSAAPWPLWQSASESSVSCRQPQLRTVSVVKRGMGDRGSALLSCRAVSHSCVAHPAPSRKARSSA
jgi:hypothetical protein